jgi:acyl dehydratase
LYRLNGDLNPLHIDPAAAKSVRVGVAAQLLISTPRLRCMSCVVVILCDTGVVLMFRGSFPGPSIHVDHTIIMWIITGGV